jgi:hypothetical protein
MQYVKEDFSCPVNDVDRYVIARKLLDSIFNILALFIRRWERIIETGYKLEGRGSILGRGERFFSSPQHPDRLSGPPSLLSNAYLELFPLGYSGRSVKITTHLHIVPRPRLVNLYLRSPIRIQDGA